MSKEQARQIQSILKELGDDISLGHCHELIARMNGFKSHNHASAAKPKEQDTWYVGYCFEQDQLRFAPQYKAVCPLVIDGDEYEEGYHLLDESGNTVGWCHDIYSFRGDFVGISDERGFQLKYSYTKETDTHNWEIFKDHSHVGWLHSCQGDWPGGNLDDNLMEDHFDYVSELAALDMKRRNIENKHATPDKIDFTLIPVDILNKENYEEICERINEIAAGIDADDEMGPGMGKYTKQQEELDALFNKAVEYEIKHNMVCPHCKTPHSRGPGCYECSDDMELSKFK